MNRPSTHLAGWEQAHRRGPAPGRPAARTSAHRWPLYRGSDDSTSVRGRAGTPPRQTAQGREQGVQGSPERPGVQEIATRSALRAPGLYEPCVGARAGRGPRGALVVLWLAFLLAGAVMIWVGSPLTAGVCLVAMGICSVQFEVPRGGK